MGKMGFGKCGRCGEESLVTTMSYFNTDMICLGCEEKEEAHPEYREARRLELEAVKRGDYNFQGVGRPSDLV